eukprot:gene26519-35184_t
MQTNQLINLYYYSSFDRWTWIFSCLSNVRSIKHKVGKIVSRAAAEHLTLRVLELSGNSTTIIGDSAVDAGQICIAPDYLFCHEKNYAKYLEHIASLLLRRSAEVSRSKQDRL